MAEAQKNIEKKNQLTSPPDGNDELSLSFAAPLGNNLARQILRSAPQLSDCQPRDAQSDTLKRWITDLPVRNHNCFT